MVTLTQINGEAIVINAELIETIEQSHDTILTLTTSRKVRVKEGLEDIIEKVVEYRRRVNSANLEDRLRG